MTREPRSGRAAVQAARRRRPGAAAGGLGVLAVLGGCTAASPGPVAWWHTLEGGPIADARPPPPGAGDPYPNLSTVPPKPPPIDPGHRAATTGALAADRANATFEARQDPLAAAPARDRNGLFAAARPLAAADPNAAGASLDAAAPPTPRGVPAAAAHAAVAAAPAPARATAASPDEPIPDIAPDTTKLPPVPDAPPAPPRLAGVAIPVTVAHLPPVAPPPVVRGPAALSDADRAALPIGFAAGSAILPIEARGGLDTLVRRRGAHAIGVIGFGESDSQDGQSQVAGMHLAAERARAVAAFLLGAGVPLASLRIEADAAGRGAAVRLLD